MRINAPEYVGDAFHGVVVGVSTATAIEIATLFSIVLLKHSLPIMTPALVRGVLIYDAAFLLVGGLAGAAIGFKARYE